MDTPVSGRTCEDPGPAPPLSASVLVGALGRLGYTFALLDAAGTVTWVSDALAQLTGHARAELVGRPFDELLAGPDGDAAPGRIATGERISRIQAGRLRCRDGTVLTVGIGLESLDDEHPGTVLALVKSLAGRRADDLDGDRLRALVDTTTDGILTLTPDGRVTAWNRGAAEIFGYTAEEMLGHSLTVLGHGEAGSDLPVLLGRIRAGERIRVHETVRRRKDGSSVHVSISGSPLRSPEGDLVGYTGIVRDVTERVTAEADRRHREDAERARAEAVEASRLKSEFLATMSHEIRTPMNGVLGMTDLLLDTGLSEEQRELATTVRASARSLLGIINDILDFSKVEAGRLDLEETEHDPADVAEDVIAASAPVAGERGLRLRLRLHPDLPGRIRGDPSRLRQILVNLVGNALKFTDAGGVVVRVLPVELANRRAGVRFEVCDTGSGIPAAAQDHLFESFRQADASITRRYGGTGLGLAISRQLVERMGGEIGVTSAPGDGSTFWFTVPVATGLAQPGRSETLAGLRVLVLGDAEDEAVRWLARRIAGHGAQSRVVTSAEELGQSGPADVLVCHGDAGPQTVAAALHDHAARSPRAPRLVVLAPDGSAPPSAGMGMRTLRQPVTRAQLVHAIAAPGRDPCPPEAEGGSAGRAAAEPLGVRVLVADDVPVNRRLAELLLRRAGYDVVTAVDGAAAVEAFGRERFDAILMDCEMPVMDGYAATGAIRALEPPGRRIPIVALTASALSGDADRAIAAGMDAHITKPIDVIRLEQVLAELLRGTGVPAAPAGAAEQPVRPQGPLDRAALDRIDALGDGALAEVVSTFLRTVPGRGRTLAAALRAEDGAAVRAEAHGLRGAAAVVGATGLAALCAELEADPEPDDSTPERLEAAIDAVVAALSGALDQRAHATGDRAPA